VFVESVIVFAAGELVVFAPGEVAAFGVGEAFVFGEGEAVGLGVGEADFFEAPFAVKGTQKAKATAHAVTRWILFFIGQVS
jgi:hypothetical protein